MSDVAASSSASTMLDLHDDWNLFAIGALNLLHVPWWFGLSSAASLTSFLFYAGCGYLILDSCWLIFVPSCVPKASRATLLMHHVVVCGCMPFAWGKPLLMRHLLRTWTVEVHSWNHIACRRLQPGRLTRALTWLNKPLFVGLRMVVFPLTWVRYAQDRALLSAAEVAAHAPTRLHVPLSLAHAAMYGLMLKWGWGLLGFGNRMHKKPASS